MVSQKLVIIRLLFTQMPHQLLVTQLIYNSCLFFKCELLNIVDLQINNTLILVNNTFATIEKGAIKIAKFMNKKRACLLFKIFIMFKSTWIHFAPNGDITLSHETCVRDISLIKHYKVSTTRLKGVVQKNLLLKEQYIAHQARGAYLVSICQLEALFDLFYANPSTKFFLNNITILNKKFKCHINNKFQRLNYIKLNQNSRQLVLFINSSFANNKDLFLQIGFIICIANLVSKASIIYWSFIKYKQISWTIFATELCEMAHGFDIKALIKAILAKVLEDEMAFVFCTDSRFLYNCLIKLEITNKKHFIIDVISLCSLYERCKIIEIKQIYGHNNPMNLMTKNKPSLALKILIGINCMNLNKIK